MEQEQTDNNNNKFIYNNKMARWDQQASVRVKPHRLFSNEEDSGKIYFPPELVPVSRHALVRALGDEALREILIQRLYTYLGFTARLEHDVVNEVTKVIAQRKSGFTFPWEMVFDAHKIYCDEAYHALFSVDLAHQIEEATGMQPHIVEQPRCLTRLQEIVATVPQDLQQLATIFFSIVSETLITSILSDIPKDKRIMQAVRAVVADHAEDEGRHHAYFAKVLEFLWPRLGPREKAVIGPLLPQFIQAFLEPDYTAAAYELAGCELQPAEVQQIIYESYPYDQIRAGIKAGSQATIRHFQRNGLFEDARIVDAFQSAGLIDEATSKNF
jgi:hypothetical protein